MYANGIDRLGMDQQVRNLNCGRNCMESLLEWRHGSRFGAEVLEAGRKFPVTVNGRSVSHVRYGARRTAHIADVQAHRNDKAAYGVNPNSYREDYGLKAIVPLPVTDVNWEDALEDYGPLIVAGHIGAVETLWNGAGHNVLVIGVTQNMIVYLDPLGKTVSGGLAFFGMRKRDANQEMTMDLNSFNSKVNNATGAVLGTCPPMTTGWGKATDNNRTTRLAIGGRGS